LSFSNVTTERSLPALRHLINHPFCDPLQEKNWPEKNRSCDTKYRRESSPTFVGDVSSALHVLKVHVIHSFIHSFIHAGKDLRGI